jgi:hypothetical protein
MPWHQALLEWSFLPSEMPVKGFVASRISLEVGKQTRRAIIEICHTPRPRIYSLVLISEAVGKCRCSMLRRCLRREITGCRFHLLPRLYGRVAGGERFSTFLHEIVIAARRIPTRFFPQKLINGASIGVQRFSARNVLFVYESEG